MAGGGMGRKCILSWKDRWVRRKWWRPNRRFHLQVSAGKRREQVVAGSCWARSPVPFAVRQTLAVVLPPRYRENQRLNPGARALTGQEDMTHLRPNLECIFLICSSSEN